MIVVHVSMNPALQMSHCHKANLVLFLSWEPKKLSGRAIDVDQETLVSKWSPCCGIVVFRATHY